MPHFPGLRRLMAPGPAGLSWPFIVLGSINWSTRTVRVNGKTSPAPRRVRAPRGDRPEAVFRRPPAWRPREVSPCRPNQGIIRKRIPGSCAAGAPPPTGLIGETQAWSHLPKPLRRAVSAPPPSTDFAGTSTGFFRNRGGRCPGGPQLTPTTSSFRKSCCSRPRWNAWPSSTSLL